MKEFKINPLFGSLFDEGEIIGAKDKKDAIRNFAIKRKLSCNEIWYDTKDRQHLNGRAVSVIETKVIDEKRYITGRWGFYKFY